MSGTHLSLQCATFLCSRQPLLSVRLIMVSLAQMHSPMQVAGAFARSALNRTSPFPSLVINGFIHNPNPLDTEGFGAQTGPRDPNFLHSTAFLDLRGEPAYPENVHLCVCWSQGKGLR
jgi:hypothetical protein